MRPILLTLALLLGACPSSLHSEVVIQALSDRVWNALTDRFTQHASFAGIFVPFVAFEPYHRGWELMNALKRRAESVDVAAK